MSKPVDMSESRFWKLYQEERAKVASDKTVLSPAQILHIARTARKRQAAG